MCGIFSSTSHRAFLELAKANQKRGSFSYSWTFLDPQGNWSPIIREFGAFPESIPDLGWGRYIGHVQAPTGGLIQDPNRIHPAETNHFKLWHNGVLKQSEIERLAPDKSASHWDTALLLNHMVSHRDDPDLGLSDIDGSFACLFAAGVNLYAFRSQAAILYHSSVTGDVSSVRMEGMSPFDWDKVYRSDQSGLWVSTQYRFVSKSSPYFFSSKKTPPTP